MVGNSCSADRHTSRNTAPSGGSSMTFNSLFWAGSRVLSPSRRIYTL